MPIPYSEVNKVVDDLFEKDFPIGATKLTINKSSFKGVVSLISLFFTSKR